MKLTEHLAEIFAKESLSLNESIFFQNDITKYWHSMVLDSEGTPYSAGFHNDRAQARKIAIAEFLERRFVRGLATTSKLEGSSWGLELIPTACGFAAGFDGPNTIYRSVAEATERWVMSKWIDDQLHIDSIDSNKLNPLLDAASRSFADEFDEVLYFKKQVAIVIDDVVLDITVAQTMGIKDEGIFPGSSAQFTGGNVWQHALLESFRHLLLVKNNPPSSKFPDNRIRFFAKNKGIALEQIAKAKTIVWPAPTIKFHRSQSMLNNEYFIARTIVEGWRSWDEGPIERFLY